MITDYDHLEIRCPMLGHPLYFSYCRTTDGKSPCRRIFNCWFQRLPVQQFIQDHYPKGILEKLSAPPKPKMQSLLELIEKAQNTKKNGVIAQEDIERS
jgi:hypothetical protein